ncbi:MAG: hypothetical protein AAFZ07_29935, partial [Actinomycetota bacterium]
MAGALFPSRARMRPALGLLGLLLLLAVPGAAGLRIAGAAPDGQDNRPGRGQIQMVFQDPYSSLNPRWRVREAIGDSLLAFGLARNRQQMRTQVASLLADVGLAPEDGDRYPHEFSG